jgi:outer membrane receptor protein involved in Fe transport
MVGESPGKITINRNISRFLPGQGDNAVFNLLRLMPGIQAAGEQSTDLLIWGGYEGQSLLTFDKFTLFGLKNYNDNISVVNPFLVKTIEILKGGYEAKYGDRVGGLVNIVGKNGNTQKPVVSLNINPTTLNGMIEIPLFKKSSLLMAYRQTYYNLYNSSDFNIFSPTRPKPTGQSHSTKLKNTIFDLSVYPDDYQFRDMNLKYSYNFNNKDQFYISMYGGGDYFHLLADASITRQMKGKPGNMRETQLDVNLLNKEENQQIGMSAFYSKVWSNRWSTKFIFSHSDFSRHLTEEIQTIDSTTQSIYKNTMDSISNTIAENSFRIDNLVHLLNGHQLEFGGGVYNNTATISSLRKMQDLQPIDTIRRFTNNRLFVYVDDYLPIGSRLLLKAGARLNLSDNQVKFHFEPRLSISYKLTEAFKLSASWGRYHQFIYKETNVDKDQNYSFLWVTSNGNTPVINAALWVSELNYSKNNLTINLGAYYKQTHNISKRVLEQTVVAGKQIDRYFPYLGNAKTYGIDFFAKKDFGKHSAWASYTISKALESLAHPNEQLPAYSLAPQHQTHELKVAGIFNIHKFYLSANYVYGSGLQILREVFADGTNDFSYNRVDAAVTYKFTPKHFSGEVGLSVLNLLDTRNLKYSNLRNFQLTPELGDIRVYTNSVPFTPTLFLKLVF